MHVLAWSLAAALAVEAEAPPADAASTVADRQAVQVTVYNNGRGLVRETRAVQVPAGLTRLRFVDVAEKVEPETVRVSALGGGRFAVLEQNYEYDLLSPAKLLEKFVGRTLTLVRTPRDGDPAGEREVQAKLLSTNNGTVWEIDGRVATNLDYGRVLFPNLPSELVARPTLAWLVDGGGGGRRTIEATYLTAGMTWRADYVLSLDAAETRAGMLGWVTIENKSGAGFEDAGLKLVAGDVRRAPPEQRPDAPSAAALRAEAVTSMAREALFEYHLYTLPRPTSLKQNQTKQVQLLDAPSIAVAKQYVLRGSQRYYYEDWSRRTGPKQKVAVAVTFRNAAASGLGLPLPKGIVRVYQRDSQGHPQFVGEDRIDHTPTDEPLFVEVGDAFDLAAERRQTDYKRLNVAPHDHESAFEIRVRNHKTEAVIVRVIEPLWGDWTLVESSHPAKKTSAYEAEFQLPVQPGEEGVLTYRVRVKY